MAVCVGRANITWSIEVLDMEKGEENERDTKQGDASRLGGGVRSVFARSSRLRHLSPSSSYFSPGVVKTTPKQVAKRQREDRAPPQGKTTEKTMAQEEDMGERMEKAKQKMVFAGSEVLEDIRKLDTMLPPILLGCIPKEVSSDATLDVLRHVRMVESALQSVPIPGKTS